LRWKDLSKATDGLSGPHYGCFQNVSSQRFLEVCMKRQSLKILLLSSGTAGQEFETCVLQPIWPDPALNCTVMGDLFNKTPKKYFFLNIVVEVSGLCRTYFSN
jgi:hypothetical protein